MVNIQGFTELLSGDDIELLQDGLTTLIEDWDADGDERNVLALPLFNDLPLLNYVCTLNSSSAAHVKVLIDHGCDVNLSSNEVKFT